MDVSRSSSLALLACACAFDSSGVGAPGGSSPDVTSNASDDPTTSTSGDPTTSSTSEDPAPTMPVETEGAAGPSMLVLVDAPIFDFADVELGSAQTHDFLLRNEGSGGAHAIEATIDGLPFAFAGGAYPGDGGTCTGTLAANASCTIVVSALPDAWGPSMGELVVSWDDAMIGPGSVEVDLGVRGVGETIDLLDNGDAEQGGYPPAGWSLIEGGGTDWQTVTTNVFAGERSFYPGTDMTATLFRIGQSVATDPWSALVDGDGVTFRVRAQTRSVGVGDDPHWVLLRFFDGTDGLLDELQSPVYDGEAWDAVELIRTAPVGTRRVQVQLRCEHVVGGACSAHFDDVSLVASYP